MDWVQLEQVVRVQAELRRWELARAAEQVAALALEAPEQGERF